MSTPHCRMAGSHADGEIRDRLMVSRSVFSPSELITAAPRASRGKSRSTQPHAKERLVLEFGVSCEGLQQGNHSVAAGRLYCLLSSFFQLGDSFAARRVMAFSHCPSCSHARQK